MSHGAFLIAQTRELRTRCPLGRLVAILKISDPYRLESLAKCVLRCKFTAIEGGFITVLFTALAVLAAMQEAAPTNSATPFVASAPSVCCAIPAGTPITIEITDLVQSKRAKIGMIFAADTGTTYASGQNIEVRPGTIAAAKIATDVVVPPQSAPSTPMQTSQVIK